MEIFTLNLGSLTLSPTWYGLMYGLAFVSGYFLLSRSHFFKNKTSQLDYLFVGLILGVIVGGRLGYVLFYNLPYFLQNPLEIFMPWLGGMSFHGGCIGVIVALWWAWKKHFRDIPFLQFTDAVVWVVPLGLFFGRIGNYINKELLGIPGYAGPLAVDLDGVTYFPTPLLEALLEGVVLFVVLLFLKRFNLKSGYISATFLVGYGTFRIIAEFFRLPDTQLGYLVGEWGTMGMVLSVIMIAYGLIVFIYNSYLSKT